MPGLFEGFNPLSPVASNQYGLVSKTVNRGSLITFAYPVSCGAPPNTIHDPYPLVLVTDIWSKHIRGVNLHYLTFPYIKTLLQRNCDNQGFSYFNVRSDRYIANAFRMYSRGGVRNPKKLDCGFLMKLLGAVRSFSKNDVEAIRNEVQKQIQAQLQVKADQLSALNASQQAAVAQKAEQLRGALQGGVERNLIYPQSSEGIHAANMPPGPGGEYSTRTK